MPLLHLLLSFIKYRIIFILKWEYKTLKLNTNYHHEMQHFLQQIMQIFLYFYLNLFNDQLLIELTNWNINVYKKNLNAFKDFQLNFILFIEPKDLYVI